MEQKEKIEKVKTLLVDSLLAEEIKTALLNNLEKFSDENLDKIIESLELESGELVKIETLLKDFIAEQNITWKSLEEKQKAKSEEIILEELSKHIK